MFTDSPTTPLRVETLISVIQDFGSRSLPDTTVVSLLQPKGLPDLNAASNQAKETIKAAIELGLISRDSGELTLTNRITRRRSVRECVLESCDDVLLAKTDVEPYLALFFSFMLGRGSDAGRFPRKEWVEQFNDTLFGGRTGNPFNDEKVTGLNRWFTYLGLGWHDSTGEFQCNPYDRLRRQLPTLFGKGRKLDDQSFMECVGNVCPELDGGELFLRANPQYDPMAKEVTLGLANALVELHLDGVIVLHCEGDSGGWSLRQAAPPVEGAMRSDRLDHVEWLKKGVAA